MQPIMTIRLKANVLTKNLPKLPISPQKISIEVFLYDNQYRLFSPIPITTDTYKYRPDYKYYQCIGTAPMCRIGIQVLYSGVLWPCPAWVTRLHHRWGANEAEISFQISAFAGV